MRADKKREYNARYYATHREQCREWQKAGSARRRAEAPHRELWRAARRRAKRGGIPFDLTPEDCAIPAVCPVLGIPLAPNIGGGRLSDGSPTIDRLIPEHGYVRGNICVISARANRIKNDATLAELRRVVTYMEEWPP